MFSYLSLGIFPCSSYHFGCHAAVSLALLEFQHLGKTLRSQVTLKPILSLLASSAALYMRL
jgi:hypothetical protein